MTAETHPIEKEQVMACLDGELSPEAAARVASHLAECAECHALQSELREVSSEMMAWNVEPSPANLTYGVNAVIRAEVFTDSSMSEDRFQTSTNFVRRVMLSRWVWGTACAAVVGMIVLKMLTPINLIRVSSHADLATLMAQRSVSEPLEVSPSPTAGPGSQGDASKSPFDRFQLAAKLMRPAAGGGVRDDGAIANGPMIARTASLKISVKDFGSARASVDRIVRARNGYAASMTINSQKGEPQSLEAELHIPDAVCDAALADLKGLGRVEQEQQGGEEVTAQVVDLDARLKNAHITETRLEEILRTRTGKVADVLGVEKEMANVREQIEQMEGEQKNLHNRITYASIQLELHEEYAASLEVGSSSVGRRIRNAVVDGFSAAVDGFLSLGLFLLYVAPSLILLGLILFWPVRWAWRRLRQAQS